ncbi:hypothetical protein H0Z60_08485 [Ectothiorhodospiraceae bacterium WFHF3C12]|nr:hypothetical protein [Ectothiorhodospiraceae bacterium WFHF3C12]
MTQSLYNVVFRGALTGAKPEDEVKFELGALFNASAEKIEALFSGKPVVVKRNVDAATATKFRAAFERAGAFCELVKADDAGDTPAPRDEADAGSEPGPQAEQPRPPEAERETAAPESGVEEVAAAPPPPAEEPAAEGASTPAGDDEAASIARSGDPNGTVLERSISSNVSSLSIDESDRPHQPHEDVPPPQVDISGLSLAEDDAPLSQRPKEAPREFDTSGMALEPAPAERSGEAD